MNIPRHYTILQRAKDNLISFANQIQEDVYIIRRAGGREYSYQTVDDLIEHKKDYIVAHHKYVKRDRTKEKFYKWLATNNIQVHHARITGTNFTIVGLDHQVYEFRLIKKGMEEFDE